MTEPGVSPFIDDLPDLDPVIAHEQTSYGWRGLTEHGEVLEVKTNGHFIGVPNSIVVAANGKPLGRRAVTNRPGIDISGYLLHFHRVVELYRANKVSEALDESNETLRAAPTLRARFNRAMVLLAAGRWRDGLSEYWDCEQSKPFTRPAVERALAAGLRPWRGEPLTGKRLLLLHAHGFGDTIMMLRYVPRLKDAVMVMPLELHELATQCGKVEADLIDCDFFAPMLHLLYMLDVDPLKVSGEPYLSVSSRSIKEKEQSDLGVRMGKRIGIAWSVGKPSDGDYPREIDLELLAGHLDGQLHSVQIQDAPEWVGGHRIHSHDFCDFADCAALMMSMDEIVSVDTAALHLAGAIGHPKVTGLLSHWASWRWQANWYDNVTLLRQTVDGDWSSALAQR
jgi:hypothetical protein